MAYDKNIPDVLQLLRLDLGDVDYTVPRNTTIARYTIESDYSPRYCIADVADDADTMDVLGAIEETMHTILDYGGNADDLRITMGLVPETEIDLDIIESGEYVPVDLGYCLEPAPASSQSSLAGRLHRVAGIPNLQGFRGRRRCGCHRGAHREPGPEPCPDARASPHRRAYRFRRPRRKPL